MTPRYTVTCRLQLQLCRAGHQPGSHTLVSHAHAGKSPTPPRSLPVTHTGKQSTAGAHSSQPYLPRPNLYEEAAAFVGNLQDFGPREAVDSQLIFVNKKATGTDSQSDIHSFQVLGMQMRI